MKRTRSCKSVRSVAATLLMIAGGVMSAAESAAPKLLFRSGFEADTRIAPGTWKSPRNRHHIVGRDHSTGFDWKESFAQTGLASDAFFEYVISRSEPPEKFVTTELREMTGPRGGPTRVLYMGVKGVDPNVSATTRNELDIHPTAAWKQGYARYWMLMHPDLLEKAAPRTWVMLMEWKEPGRPGVSTGGTNNWRTNVTLRRANDGPMFWQFLRQEVQPLRRDEQAIVNVAAPIPAGRWFQLEAFWRWGKSGRVWFAIDGQTVFDQFGRFEHASHPLGLKFWALFKNYRGKEWYDADLSDGDETWFAYDDVEIWSGFPSGHPMRDTEPLLVENFETGGDTPWGTLPARWWLEGEAGGARARIADGRLLVDSTENAGKGCTVWLDYEMPGDVDVAFDVHVVSALKDANNMNLLFQFRDPKIANLRETRAERAQGSYKLYHSARLEGTIVTFLSNGTPDQARLRVRQVPPFEPVVQERNTYHARAGHTYYCIAAKRGNRFTFAVDGQTLLETELPAKKSTAPGGYLGLRTWNTKLWWDNVVIRRPVRK